jgi:hypothetical protein
MEFTTDNLLVIKAHEHYLIRNEATGMVTIFVNPEKIEIEFPEWDLLQLRSQGERQEFVAGKIRAALERRANGNVFHPRRHEMRNFG